MKDISIIIATTNNKSVLGKCLKSIQDKTNKISYEIILIDNGSQDGSPNMVKQTFPAIKLIENKENLGFLKATNQGLNIYQAKYVILLNDDTIVKDGAFDKMFDFMETHPKVGACGPKLLNIDGSIQRQGSVLGLPFWKTNQPKEVDFVVGACLMVRKETIDKVGILDENLFFYNDDLDWCMSMRKAGFKIYYLPHAEIIHYGGYSSKRTFNRRLFVEGFKGGLYYCRKHYGKNYYIIYKFLLGIFMSLSLVIIYTLYFKKDRADKLSAYQDIVKLAFSN